MSKLLLSNNEKIFSQMHNQFVNVGFNRFEKQVVSDNVFLSVYKKLRINSENLYCERDDFIAVSGTFIYKGNIGTPALQNIFHDFDGDNNKPYKKRNNS